MNNYVPKLPEEILNHIGGDANDVASAEAFPIHSYRDLVTITAKVAYMNKNNLLFYRGQATDYKGQKASKSTFYPTIYRGHLNKQTIQDRFRLLDEASQLLKQEFVENDLEDSLEVKKRKYVRWSILQHYGVCGTPFLDFTHSLRVACSFAMDPEENMTDEAFIYLFGLPYLTNRITTNSEQDIVNVRLLGICPSIALRPHFQEGYVASTDEVTYEYDRKSNLDFNKRLIAKFKIPNNDSFWGKGFGVIPRKSLYPDGDQVELICDRIKSQLK